jgi:hypothetical protein
MPGVGVAIVIATVIVVLIASPLLRRFVTVNLGEVLRDVPLVLLGMAWNNRVTRWTAHAKDHVALPQRNEYDYLTDCLGILDNKFSALLQLLGFFGVMASLATSRFWDGILVGLLTAELRPFFVAVPIIWMLTVIGCLIAVGNVRWAELSVTGKDSAGPYTNLDAETRKQRASAILANAVVGRTAMLRGLSFVALVNFVVAAALFIFVATHTR